MSLEHVVEDCFTVRCIPVKLAAGNVPGDGFGKTGASVEYQTHIHILLHITKNLAFLQVTPKIYGLYSL